MASGCQPDLKVSLSPSLRLKPAKASPAGMATQKLPTSSPQMNADPVRIRILTPYGHISVDPPHQLHYKKFLVLCQVKSRSIGAGRSRRVDSYAFFALLAHI